MNQEYSINKSVNRYARKRNSHDVIRSNNTTKYQKKPFPEVFIDLNQKKSKGLLIDNYNSRIVDHTNQTTVNTSNQLKKNWKGNKQKEDHHVKFLNYTQITKKQDQNKNILNEYREEVELLRLENQEIKQENLRLKQNQIYFSKQIRQIKRQQFQESSKFTQTKNQLEGKIEIYILKIKQLYEQLIREKKKKGKNSQESNISKPEYQQINYCFDHNRNRTKGELQTYRHQESKVQIKQATFQNEKKFTSPSHSHFHQEKFNLKLDDFQYYQQYLRKIEQKGEEAFYRAGKQQENKNNTRSDFDQLYYF